MTDITANAGLELAVQLSRELVLAADRGDFEALHRLDAERLKLLKFFREKNRPIDEASGVLLQTIAQLNDRALGIMGHRHRIKAREIDLAAVGRRAVNAYSTTG